MNDEIELTTILDCLLTVKFDGDPTIELMEVAVPHLRRHGWINRFAFDAWARIASALRTVELEWLVKSLIVAERDYGEAWFGGSVAAPIWLFRAYSDRADANAQFLANWALQNRGRNEWTPFGRRTAATSLDQWHIEQEARSDRERRQNDEKIQRAKEKAQLAKEAAERSVLRKIAGRDRHEKLLEHVEKLRRLSNAERLTYIAISTEFPLECIPPQLIAESISAAPMLDHATKERLVKRIDRRSRRVWKQLRLALEPKWTSHRAIQPD